jgi:hypothetical protein
MKESTRHHLYFAIGLSSMLFIMISAFTSYNNWEYVCFCVGILIPISFVGLVRTSGDMGNNLD